MDEHIEIGHKLSVYLSVVKVSEGKAFVSQPPVYDLVINSEPFSDLWEGHQVGAMLHEIHHFTIGNRQKYLIQRDKRLPMGAIAPYEIDAFQFQRNLGFPASDRRSGLIEDEQ